MCCIQLATGAFGGFKVAPALVLLSMLLLFAILLVAVTWTTQLRGPHASTAPSSVPHLEERWSRFLPAHIPHQQWPLVCA
jgi:hypothetical protein